MTEYIDAHCHYVAQPPVGALRGFIYNSARASDWAVAIAAHGPGAYTTIGIHPWYVADVPPDWGAQMERLLCENPGLMIGEIGLDASWGDVMGQMPTFVRQIEMANRFGRVAHIHCVRAWDKMLRVFAGAKMRQPVVFHGFNGNSEIVASLLRHSDAYFSFGPRFAPRAASGVPVERVLVESDADAPNVACEILPRITEQIAEIYGLAPTDACKIIYDNTTRILENGR